MTQWFLSAALCSPDQGACWIQPCGGVSSCTSCPPMKPGGHGNLGEWSSQNPPSAWVLRPSLWSYRQDKNNWSGWAWGLLITTLITAHKDLYHHCWWNAFHPPGFLTSSVPSPAPCFSHWPLSPPGTRQAEERSAASCPSATWVPCACRPQTHLLQCSPGPESHASYPWQWQLSWVKKHRKLQS